MRHSIRRPAARALAGGAAAAIIGLLITAPAAATTVVPDGAEQLVHLELHTLEPAAPAPGDRVEITGSITNVTADPLHNVQVLLRYDGRPITARSDVARVSTDAGLHWGWRPGHIYDIVRDELPPGESASFDLEFTIASACPGADPASVPCLALPETGVYAIGVDGNVTTTDDDRQTGGTARTVVPWQIGDADPIPVALMWPVVGTPEIGDDVLRETGAQTARPDGTPDSTATPEGTPDSTTTSAGTPGPEGELDAGETAAAQGEDPPEFTPLLAAPGDAPVTWAVDPDTWSPAVAEAVGGDGELMVLPPSVPDAGALARVDRGLAGRVTAHVARLQQEFTPSATQRADVPARIDVAWPGAGVVTEHALQAWADAGYDTVVLPRDAVAMPSKSATVSLDMGGNRLTAVLTDPGLDSAIADNTRPGETSLQGAVLDLRQRWLAETVLARDEPFWSGSAGLVAAPPAGWRPPPEVLDAVLEVWTQTEWITPTRLSGITDSSPLRRETAPAAVLIPLLAGAEGLPSDYARTVKELHDDLARYQSLLAEPNETSAASPSADASVPDDTSNSAAASPTAVPDDTGGPAAGSPSADASAVPDNISGSAAGPALAAAHAASVAWSHDLDTARAEVAALRETVAEALSGVSVVVNPSNTLSGNTGVFPVNIANELAHAVTVRLEFDPANESRLAIEPVEARVPGGQQQTVQVRAEAVANGEVPVSVQLSTVDGAPLGGAQHTIVNATHYGTIGWFVVGGSALLFAGGLSWRMLRGRRRTGP